MVPLSPALPGAGDIERYDESEVSFAPSKPHEYWRWRDHTTTYTEFKKEMWVYMKDASPHARLDSLLIGDGAER